MLRFFILAILLYVLYRLVKGSFKQSAPISKSSADGVIDEMVQDPYCGIYMPRRQAVRRVQGGKEIFFCSKECAERFEIDNKV